RGRARRSGLGLEDPEQVARRGVPAPSAPLRPPVRRCAPDARDQAQAGARGPDRPALRRARGGGGDMNRPFAITLDVGSSLANKTGSWRTERPVYRDLLPPCHDARPAGENIQAWLYEAEAGGEGYERAWRKLMEDNPFPAIMGRVCYHPCETACNRTQLDTAVGINAVGRLLWGGGA